MTPSHVTHDSLSSLSSWSDLMQMPPKATARLCCSTPYTPRLALVDEFGFASPLKLQCASHPMILLHRAHNPLFATQTNTVVPPTVSLLLLSMPLLHCFCLSAPSVHRYTLRERNGREDYCINASSGCAGVSVHFF